MNLISQTRKLELLLKKRQLLSLDEARPKMAIECKQGVLWVTGSGDYRDHMLSVGQKYKPASKSKVIIEALNDARLNIEEE